MITQEELMYLLFYNSITGDFHWNVSRSNRIKVGDKAGSLCGVSGYTIIWLGDRRYRAHRLVWLYHYGRIPAETVDHIDMHRSNNRVENLRLCNRSENQNNSGKHADNTSGFKGVHKHRQTGKWCAQAGINGKKKYLGLFPTPEEASKAYNDYVKIAHGAFYLDTTK